MFSRHLKVMGRKHIPSDLSRATAYTTLLANTVFHTWPAKLEAIRSQPDESDRIETLDYLLNVFDTTIYPDGRAAYLEVAAELTAVADEYTGPVRACCAHEAVFLMALDARQRVDIMIRLGADLPIAIEYAKPTSLTGRFDRFEEVYRRQARPLGSRPSLRRLAIALAREISRAAVARPNYRGGAFWVELREQRAGAVNCSNEGDSEPQLRPGRVDAADDQGALIATGDSDTPRGQNAPNDAADGCYTDVSGVFRFVRHPEAYVIEAFGERQILPHLLGLHDIARLLRTPGRPVATFELLARPTGRGTAAPEELTVARTFSEQPVLDQRAKKEIEGEMARLTTEVEEADNDVDRNDSQAKLDELRRYHGQATGLRGRPRKLDDQPDRERRRIRMRLTEVFTKMNEPRVGLHRTAKHLSNAIKPEGGAFSYNPDGQSPPWQFE